MTEDNNRRLYIIAGCNGAGKTTASYTVLPYILDCNEFVNADEIAKGISPFKAENISIQAGKIMLKRIDFLIENKSTFAFETTLSSKSLVNIIKRAKSLNYSIVLIYFWLNSENLAIQRVNARVREGGHNIDKHVIRRRYSRGLENFFKLYKSIVDEWIFIDNSKGIHKVVAEGTDNYEHVFINEIWNKLKGKHNG